GEVYTTDGIKGGALWNPPNTWKQGILDQIRMTPALARITTWRRLPRVAAGITAAEKRHPHMPHYYLLGLGVEPDLQGRGIGTALMRPILERCDAEGVPAYLESSK